MFGYIYSYEQGKASGLKRGAWGCRENAKSDDQITGKQTLESMNPGPLEPFLPANWEKIHFCLMHKPFNKKATRSRLIKS